MTTTALMPAPTPATVIDRGGAGLPIAAVQQRVAMVLELMANVLEEKKDYGKIPGTDKPTLFKPGAEKLCMAFQLAAARPFVEDLSTPDEIRYRVSVPIEANDGRVLSVGVGEASTNEEKYRWRKPVCDEEFFETPEHLRREKWFKGRGNDGNYKGRQIRTSPADLANTVYKMAHKRAFIHATLMATAASSVFNQDLEDFTAELQESIIDGEGDQPQPQAPKGPQRKSAQTSQPATAAMAKKMPADAQVILGNVSKVYDDKSPFAIYLKGSDIKFTTFEDAVAKLAKQLVGTDHVARLHYTVTTKGDRTYHNAVGIELADQAPPAAATQAPAAAAEPQQQNLTAGDIFGDKK